MNLIDLEILSKCKCYKLSTCCCPDKNENQSCLPALSKCCNKNTNNRTNQAADDEIITQILPPTSNNTEIKPLSDLHTRLLNTAKLTTFASFKRKNVKKQAIVIQGGGGVSDGVDVMDSLELQQLNQSTIGSQPTDSKPTASSATEQ